MISQITTALSRGFKSKQIIDYLLRKFPNHSEKIKEALAAGFTVDQIVRYLGGGKKLLNQFEDQKVNENEINTEYAKTRRKDLEQDQRYNKMAMAAGGAAVGGIGAGMAAKALSRSVPTNLLGYIPGTTPGPQSNPLTSQSPMGPGPNSPGVQLMPTAPINQPSTASISPVANQPQAPTIPQPPVQTQAIQPQRDINKSVDIIKNSGQEATVKNLIEGGLSPSDIKDTLSVILGKKKLAELEKASGSIEQAIADYSSTITQQPQEMAQAEIQPIEQPIAESIEAPIEIEQKKNEPIQKGQLVSSSQGIGEVKEIRNGKALVEVDGKIHKVDEDDLEPSEFKEDEIADAYDDLMSKIPEEHRSGFISWAGYDEDTNTVGFIPRGGNYEELHNITPEEANRIKEGKGVARTSGEKREGLWVMGEDTRGGIISQIIHDRRKANKSQEDKQLKFGFEELKKEKQDKGMKPIFDEMAHARGLSQARDRKKALEARELKKKEKEKEIERLKKEKDEAKKRKKSS